MTRAILISSLWQLLGWKASNLTLTDFCAGGFGRAAPAVLPAPPQSQARRWETPVLGPTGQQCGPWCPWSLSRTSPSTHGARVPLPRPFPRQASRETQLPQLPLSAGPCLLSRSNVFYSCIILTNFHQVVRPRSTHHLQSCWIDLS